jgi:hypothetical protein
MIPIIFLPESTTFRALAKEPDIFGQREARIRDFILDGNLDGLLCANSSICYETAVVLDSLANKNKQRLKIISHMIEHRDSVYDIKRELLFDAAIIDRLK